MVDLRHPRVGALLASCCVVVAMGGCAHENPPRQQETRNLAALAILYSKFVGAHGGRTPTNQEEFVRYINKSEQPLLKQFEITQTEKLFVSGRSGQPMVVDYGGGKLSGSDPIIAYEGEPVGGKRLVVRPTGVIEELDEDAFQQQKPKDAPR